MSVSGHFGLRTVATLTIAIAAAIPPAAAAGDLRVIHSFRLSDGWQPVGQPVLDGHERLYGTTWSGGAKGNGTLFMIEGRTFTTLYEFKGGQRDGAGPLGSLFATPAGRIYGTTERGGSADAGTVFEYTPAAGYRMIASVPGRRDGKAVYAGVVADQDGALYGGTVIGGDPECNCGTIFRLALDTHELTTLHRFHGKPDGASLVATMSIVDGRLQGTANTGGPNGWTFPHAGAGTAFSMARNGSDLRIVAPTAGTRLNAGLTRDHDGNAWGVAEYGGDFDRGGIFRVDAQGAYQLVHSFAPDEGRDPQGTLLLASDGLLYGTTLNGGDPVAGCDCGSIFSIDPTTFAFRTVHSFDGRHGAAPPAGLVQSPSGAFYGVTRGGGWNGSGTVFRFVLD